MEEHLRRRRGRLPKAPEVPGDTGRTFPVADVAAMDTTKSDETLNLGSVCLNASGAKLKVKVEGRKSSCCAAATRQRLEEEEDSLLDSNHLPFSLSTTHARRVVSRQPLDGGMVTRRSIGQELCHCVHLAQYVHQEPCP